MVDQRLGKRVIPLQCSRVLVCARVQSHGIRGVPSQVEALRPFSRPQSRRLLPWSVMRRKAPTTFQACPSSRGAEGPFDTGPHRRCGVGRRKRKGLKARSIAWYRELPIGLRLVCWPIWADVPSWSAMRRSFGPPENPYRCRPTPSVWAGMARTVGAEEPVGPRQFARSGHRASLLELWEHRLSACVPRQQSPRSRSGCLANILPQQELTGCRTPAKPRTGRCCVWLGLNAPV